MKITANEKYYEYVTSDGKQKTTCVLELKNMDKFGMTMYGLNIIEKFAVERGLKTTKMNIPNTIKATVTCKPGDTYDSTIGRAEARAAAYRKLDLWKIKFASVVTDQLSNVMAEMLDVIVKDFDESDLNQ